MRMQLLYYNCTFALFIFSFAQAGHRGTCLRPLHIFALLLLFTFPRGACGRRNHSFTILAQSVQGLGISQITVLFTTLVPVAAPEVEVWGGCSPPGGLGDGSPPCGVQGQSSWWGLGGFPQTGVWGRSPQKLSGFSYVWGLTALIFFIHERSEGPPHVCSKSIDLLAHGHVTDLSKA